MWGLYIHIPFCPTRCIYCDFYSQSNLSLQGPFVESLCQELCIYHSQDSWRVSPRTIYLGGGTPSTLPVPLLQRLVEQIHALWEIDKDTEITIEANPEDVSPKWAEGVARLGFNRISLGVQSFDDDTLRFLRRRHSAEQIGIAIERIRQVGITNISIDIIFGLPQGYEASWLGTLDSALSLPITHLSGYGLTYESGTPLDHLNRGGVIIPASDEVYVTQYYSLVAACQEAGLRHYELSNWAIPGYESQHNSAYWRRIPYLGAGPSAHSYIRGTRWCNVPDIKQYMMYISQGKLPIANKETLSPTEIYEEIIMLGLRTIRGIDLNNKKIDRDKLLDIAGHFINKGLLVHTDDGYLRLSHRGLVWCDHICTELCY